MRIRFFFELAVYRIKDLQNLPCIPRIAFLTHRHLRTRGILRIRHNVRLNQVVESFIECYLKLSVLCNGEDSCMPSKLRTFQNFLTHKKICPSSISTKLSLTELSYPSKFCNNVQQIYQIHRHCSPVTRAKMQEALLAYVATSALVKRVT